MEWTPVYPNGKTKTLTFSYDDGQIEDVRLIEIFNQYHMKGTFNLNSGWFIKNGDDTQLKEIIKRYDGHEIACHGVYHPFLERLPQSSQLSDILEDRKALELVSGRIVRGMAYPYGTHSTALIPTLRAAGIVYSRTISSTKTFFMPDDMMLWNPTCHHTDPELMRLAESFKGTSYPLAIFYVWGHSYEFSRKNNWNVIEDLCASLADREDVWYAANIEIFDYLTAIKRLEFSADSRIIHNPSAISVWLRPLPEGEAVEIPAGATLHF